MSRSAVRVRSSALYFSCKSRKKEKTTMYVSRALSAVEYPKASSSVLACYKWLQATAGGVGEFSGIDRLTDACGFWRLRHKGRGCYAPALLFVLFNPSDP